VLRTVRRDKTETPRLEARASIFSSVARGRYVSTICCRQCRFCAEFRTGGVDAGRRALCAGREALGPDFPSPGPSAWVSASSIALAGGAGPCRGHSTSANDDIHRPDPAVHQHSVTIVAAAGGSPRRRQTAAAAPPGQRHSFPRNSACKCYCLSRGREMRLLRLSDSPRCSIMHECHARSYTSAVHVRSPA
jgi:hypothetical protein